AIPRASQEEVAKVHLGALAQALLLHRAEYVDCCGITAPQWRGIQPAPSSSHRYQDPERVFIQHNQEGVVAPVVSLPVQGIVAADGVVATRQLTPLVGGAPTTTITLRLVWSALGSRLLFESGSRDVACGTIQNARVPRGAVHRGEQRH